MPTIFTDPFGFAVTDAEIVRESYYREYRYGSRRVQPLPQPEVAAWSLARDVTPPSSPAAQVGRGV